MSIDLSPEERELLEQVLSEALGDVREQAYKAEVREYKDQLHARERLLRGLLSRVSSTAPA
jgi:hypothetical protein